MVSIKLEIPDTKADLDGAGFGMDLNTQGYPPSSNNSFSSISCYGPFTPTSGRSTPPDSINFATSFSSSVDPFFDLTPPSSAVSPYFQMGVKYDSLFDPTVPVTPSSSHFDFGGVPFDRGSQQTPPQGNNALYPYSAGLAPSPLPHSPFAATYFNQRFDNNYDGLSTWHQQPDSPITFEVKEEPGSSYPLPTPTHHGRRPLIEPAMDKTTALIKAQTQSSPLSGKTSSRKPKPPRTTPTKALGGGIEVDVAEGNKFQCDWEGGCTRKFKKKEHMVRHCNSIHRKYRFHCQFCKQTHNRSDNLLSHYRNHAKEGGKTEYFPEAAVLVTKLEARRKAGKAGETARRRAKEQLRREVSEELLDG